MEFSIKQKSNINLDSTDKTCSMFFSWDAFFNHIVFVALYLLIFRLFYTFLFAFIFAQQWHVEKVWGWFPIVAFNSDAEMFTKMNSYAIIMTGVTVLSMFIFQVFAHYQPQRIYKIYAWYIGVIMLLVQYLILIIINYRLRFSIDTNLWMLFVGFIIIATVLLYAWYKFVRQWKFDKYIKKQQKLKNNKKKNA